MATYAELGKESWWVAEFEPPTLAKLNADLRRHYNLGPMYIGSKGDNRHLSGYHRSRAWIQNSRYCTNRSYSVTETAGNRSGGNSNWLAAIDMTIPHNELLAACQRLDAVVRSGQMEKVTEWYGNDDGDSRVDGYNNIENRVASSDSSHLWHLHISFDRGRVNEDHSDLFAVLTGIATKEEDEMGHMVVDHNGSTWIAPGPATSENKLALYILPSYYTQRVYERAGWRVVDLRTEGNMARLETLPWYDLQPEPWEFQAELSAEALDEVSDAAREGAEAGSLTHEEVVAAVNEAEDS